MRDKSKSSNSSPMRGRLDTGPATKKAKGVKLGASFGIFWVVGCGLVWIVGTFYQFMSPGKLLTYMLPVALVGILLSWCMKSK